MPNGLPLFKPPYSHIIEIDQTTGERVRMQRNENEDDVRNRELLKDLHLPPLGDSGKRQGGPLLTKTPLIHGSATGGTNDGPQLVARNKATGNIHLRG